MGHGRWWKVLALTKRAATALCLVLLELTPVAPITVLAQSQCAVPSYLSPRREFNSRVGAWDLQVSSQEECSGGEKVSVEAGRASPADHVSGGGSGSNQSSGGGHGGFLSIPIFCRRDDYMFLPPDAQGGIPCVSVPQDAAFDPGPLAARLAAGVPPPDLRIRMNPEKGLVNVPTWFWVEGYDGGTLSAGETVLQQHNICHLVAIRDANGLAQLDETGRPRTRLDCHTEDTTFDVEVRLWPKDFAWDFGDHSAPQTIGCAGVGDCSDSALGSPFVDASASHASPIQHPYVWSSLGVN